MARRAGLIQLDSVLEQLDNIDEWIAEGSDDDLGMEDNHSYDSCSSEEGIILVTVTGRNRTLFLSILYHFSEFTMP